MLRISLMSEISFIAHPDAGSPLLALSVFIGDMIIVFFLLMLWKVIFNGIAIDALEGKLQWNSCCRQMNCYLKGSIVKFKLTF